MKSVSILLVFVMSLLFTGSPQTASIPNNQAEKETIINPFEIYIENPKGEHYYYSFSGDLMTTRQGGIYYLNSYKEYKITYQNVKRLNDDEVRRINEYIDNIEDFDSSYYGVTHGTDGIGYWVIHLVINKKDVAFYIYRAMDDNINKLIDYIIDLSPIEIENSEGTPMKKQP